MESRRSASVLLLKFKIISNGVQQTYLFLDQRRPSRLRRVVEALTAEAAEVLRPAVVAVEATARAGWRPRVAERRTAEAIIAK